MDLRSRTPVGPFSEPGLLDFDAPSAVKVARGRVQQYHIEHGSGAADIYSGPKSPTKAKAGSAQYEV